MSLIDWRRNGWLAEHSTSAREIADLLKAVERDLADARTPGLSVDWRMNIAYNAALQSASAALAASGYRASRDQRHYRIIQSLVHTVGLPEVVVAQLDRFRVKRNRGTYERAGMVSDREAAEMISLAVDIHARVFAWLEKKHGGLLKDL
jgi:uncharacterized protein (UPF0332 family)